MKNLSKNTIPNTSSKAQVSKLERVQDVFAIEVKNAKYYVRDQRRNPGGVEGLC